MGRAWIAIAAMAIALFLAAFGYAVSRPADEAAAWFAALGTIVAIAALAAALIAVMYAKPGYDAWSKEVQAHPRMRLWFEVPNLEGLMDPVEERVTEVRSPFIVRIAIANDGDATLRAATLNVMVPTTASIRPRDAPEKTHYLIEWPTRNEDICPGGITRVNFTAAERDFPPGRDHVYHVEIRAKPGDAVPVRAVLDGDPPPEVAIQHVFHVIK